MAFEQESAYQIYLNKKGEMLIVISRKDGEARNPRLLYAGGEHALLQRSDEQMILLDYLNEGIRAPLAEVSCLTVAEFETDGKTFVRDYGVAVDHVSKLPLSEEDLMSIMTPEQATEKLDMLLDDPEQARGKLNMLLGPIPNPRTRPRRRKKRSASVFIDAEKLYGLLTSKIIGQDNAMRELSEVMQIHLAKRYPERPLNVFLAGPTGVGKTESALALSASLRELTGIPFKPLRVDCNILLDSHTATPLLGSPAGYVGHDEEPIFSPLASDPRTVVLFDEIEKATPNVMRVLMNAMDNGSMQVFSPVDGEREIDCRRTIFLFTSNLPLKLDSGFGFRAAVDAAVSFEDQFKDQLVRNGFAPEIAARIQAFILFGSLNQSDMKKIIELELKKCAGSFGLKVRGVPENIVQELLPSTVSKFGLRSLKNVISKKFGKAFAVHAEGADKNDVVSIHGTLNSLQVSHGAPHRAICN